MSDITKASGQLIPGDVNTPLDARSRVKTLDDVQTMQNPFVGCIFYCEEDDKFYVVKTLKASTISGETVENSAVETYEEFKRGYTPEIGDNDTWVIDGVDTGKKAVYTVSGVNIQVDELQGGFITVAQTDAFPIAVLTAKGTFYPVEKGTVTRVDGVWRINVASYLAYDNVMEFTPPWYVYCAGAVK